MLIDIEYSKLRIREISIDEVDTIANSDKFYIFGLSSTKNVSFYKNLYKNHGEIIKRELNGINEIFSLEEGDEVNLRISEKSEYERKIISSIIDLIKIDVAGVHEWQEMYELIQVLEVLVRCLRNEGLNKQFYNKRFSYLTTKTLKPNLTSYQSKSLAFKSGKHDVLDVINILLESEDDVFINLGSDYNIDEVRNITIVSHRLVKENDWVKLVRLGKLGNKIRDNISIAYLIPAEIDIPKNKVGIPEGKFETVQKRHLCIIKDGYYWKDYLTVRVSPNVYDKLKRTGIEMEELTEGEYMLSLKSLPLYSRKRFNTTNILGEVGNILGELRDLRWKSYLYLESKDYEKTEKEKFLESLGIVDGICENESKKQPEKKERRKKGEIKKETVQSFCIETITPDILPAVKRNEWEANPTGPEVIERFTELSNKLIDYKLVLSCINKFQNCGLAVQDNKKYNINWRCKRGSIEIPLVPYNW